jgi:hypothetical protein
MMVIWCAEEAVNKLLSCRTGIPCSENDGYLDNELGVSLAGYRFKLARPNLSYRLSKCVCIFLNSI